MAFVLDASLRIASVTVAETVKQELAGLAKGVDFGKLTGFTGLSPTAVQSVTHFTAALDVAVTKMAALAEAAKAAGATIAASFQKAASAMESLSAKMPTAPAGAKASAVASAASMGAAVGVSQATVSQQIAAALKNVPSYQAVASQIGPQIIEAMRKAQAAAAAAPIKGLLPPPPAPGVGGLGIPVGGPQRAIVRQPISPLVAPSAGVSTSILSAEEMARITTGMKTVADASAKTGVRVTADMVKGKNAATDFADSIFLAGKRYAAFVLATAGGFAGLAALRSGAAAVVDFDATMTKLDQTLRPTQADLGRLRQQILDLSVTTGTSAKEVSEVAVRLSQAGFHGESLKGALDAIAKVPLLPSFEGTAQATEGLIAVMGQFKIETEDIPAVFDRLNEVAKKYAVTSGDLFEAIKRGGGTWSALGGTLDEFLAVVTATKQTTQESMDAIATGWRTISERITRPETLAYLRGLGVQTADTTGKLLPLYRILEQTSKVFQGAPEERRAEIARTMGGSRQVGRLIPVLSDFGLANEVLRTSLSSAGSVQADVTRGMQTLAKQFDILKAKANELVQALAPDVFIPFIKFLTAAGGSALALTNTLAPLLKMLLTLGAAAAAVRGVGLMAGLAGRLTATTGMAGATETALGLGLLGTAKHKFLSGRARGLGLEEGQMMMPWGAPGGPTARGVLTSGAAQLGYLAVAASVGPQLTEFGLKLAGASESAAQFAASMVRSVAIMLGVFSVLKGQTVGQTMRGFLPAGMGGTATGMMRFLGPAAAVATLAATAGMIRYQQVEDAINKKLDDVTEKIKGIPVPDPSSDAQVKSARDTLIDETIRGIREAVEYYSGFTGTLASLGKRLSALFSGDIVGAFNPKKPDVDAGEIIDKVIGQNLDLLHSIIENAVKKGGANFEQGLRAATSERLHGLGLKFPEQAGKEITDRLISKAGGWNAIRQALDKQAAAIEQAQLAQRARVAAQELAKVIVPPTLVGQLVTLGKAVDEAAKGITASTSAFEAQAGTVQAGGVNAPKLPQQVDKEAVSKLLAGGGLAGLETAKPDLQRYVQTSRQMQDYARDFAAGISQAQQQAVEANRLAGIKQYVEPLDLANRQNMMNEIDKFIAANKVPEKLQRAVRAMLTDVGEAIAKGAELQGPGLPQEELDRVYKKHLANVLPQSEDIVRMAEQELNARMGRLQWYGAEQASRLQMQVNQPNTPESQYARTRELLEQAGIPFRPTQPTGTLGDITKDTSLIANLNQRTVEVTAKLADVLQMIYQASATGRAIDQHGRERTMPDLLQEYKPLLEQSLQVQAARESVLKSFGAYESFMQERQVGQKEAQQVASDLTARETALRETQRALATRGTGGTEAEQYALRRQEEAISESLAELRKPLAIAQQIVAGPAEGNKELSKQLRDALIESKTGAAKYLEREIQMRQPGYDPSLAAGIDQTMQQNIEALARVQQEIADLKTGRQTQQQVENLRAQERQIAQIGIDAEKMLAERAGLNDPFGSQVFRRAVDKFEASVAKMTLTEVPPAPPAKMVEMGAGRRLVPDQWTEPEKASWERALFGGMTRQQVEAEADQLLAQGRSVIPQPQRFNESSWSTWRGRYTKESPYKLSEIRDLGDNKARDAALDALAKKITEQQKAAGIWTDDKTEARIRLLLQSRQGNVGLENFNVTGGVEAAYRDYEKARFIHEASTRSMEDLKASTDAAASSLNQLATVAQGPAVGQSPAFVGPPSGPRTAIEQQVVATRPEAKAPQTPALPPGTLVRIAGTDRTVPADQAAQAAQAIVQGRQRGMVIGPDTSTPEQIRARQERRRAAIEQDEREKKYKTAVEDWELEKLRRQGENEAAGLPHDTVAEMPPRPRRSDVGLQDTYGKMKDYRAGITEYYYNGELQARYGSDNHLRYKYDYAQTPVPEQITRDEAISLNPAMGGDPNQFKDMAQEWADRISGAIDQLKEVLTPTAQPAAPTDTLDNPTEPSAADQRGILSQTDQDQQQGLVDALAQTTDAIRSGIDLKLETMQNVNVNVSGLSEAVEGELKPALTDIATKAAKELIRQTLVDLANASDAEGARVFTSAARNLA